MDVDTYKRIFKELVWVVFFSPPFIVETMNHRYAFINFNQTMPLLIWVINGIY